MSRQMNVFVSPRTRSAIMAPPPPLPSHNLSSPPPCNIYGRTPALEVGFMKSNQYTWAHLRKNPATPPHDNTWYRGV